MWKPYLKVIARKAQQALHVLDRFHICAHLSQAIDEVRAQEARELKAQGEEPVLTQSRCCCSNAPSGSPKNRAAGWPICCGTT
jgi:transposase